MSTTVVAMLLMLIADLAVLAETVVPAVARLHLDQRRRAGVAQIPSVMTTSGSGRPCPLGVASCLLLLTQQTAKCGWFAAILLAVGRAVLRGPCGDTARHPPDRTSCRDSRVPLILDQGIWVLAKGADVPALSRLCRLRYGA